MPLLPGIPRVPAAVLGLQERTGSWPGEVAGELGGRLFAGLPQPVRGACSAPGCSGWACLGFEKARLTDTSVNWGTNPTAS